MKIDLAARRLEREQATARQHETITTIVDACDDRASVAGEFVAEFVDDLAGELVKCDDARAVVLECLFTQVLLRAAFRAAADLGDEQVAFDDRRAADAEEILDD